MPNNSSAIEKFGKENPIEKKQQTIAIENWNVLHIFIWIHNMSLVAWYASAVLWTLSTFWSYPFHFQTHPFCVLGFIIYFLLCFCCKFIEQYHWGIYWPNGASININIHFNFDEKFFVMAKTVKHTHAHNILFQTK